MDWFLHDSALRHERVKWSLNKYNLKTAPALISKNKVL